MSQPRPTSRGRGFTLIELIAVIVVLAILAGVAIPRYIDYSQRAQAAAIATSLKRMSRALLSYRMDFGVFPGANGQFFPLPTTMNPYIDAMFLEQSRPLGGRYFYNGPTGGPSCVIGISAWPSALSATAMLEVDRLIDDGSLSTGVGTIFAPGNEWYSLAVTSP